MNSKPLIGMLVDKLTPLTSYEAAESLGVNLLLFNPNGIDWKGKEIEGLLFEKGMWKKQICPFPAVVYNRRYSSNYEITSFLELAIGKGKVFNCITRFNKWEVFRVLKNSSISNYLPETFLYQTENVLDLLHLYRNLILKPAMGHHGRGVYFIELTVDFKYRLFSALYKTISIERHHTEKDSTTAPHKYVHLLNQCERVVTPAKINTTNKDTFIHQVNQLIGEKEYLIQQYIPLDLFEQKIYDIRMYVQKNKEGKWTISNGFCRVGQSHSFISNICTELKSYQDILEGDTKLTVKTLNEIRMVSLLTAQSLERELGHLGELSVDFGLDEAGKPWIIEVNGKTQKKFVKRLNNLKLTREIYLKPIEYAKYLALKETDFRKAYYDKQIELPPSSLRDSSSGKQDLIQINKADIADLIKIHRIGEKRARQIIELRRMKPFTSYSDLQKIKGVGSSFVTEIEKQGIISFD
ncbi:YheC/YheD family protein [Bacillus sp. FJAT-44742]|uniref:YheC/YheD family protein n=1 Tax=Bacillus sp. FJAT-44742 TaxID=2014005 RepID=UPI000C24A37D|nr:YheC/YheD family protein [Bacillus sp. FJAT-44742]